MNWLDTTERMDDGMETGQSNIPTIYCCYRVGHQEHMLIMAHSDRAMVLMLLLFASQR